VVCLLAGALVGFLGNWLFLSTSDGMLHHGSTLRYAGSGGAGTGGGGGYGGGGGDPAVPARTEPAGAGGGDGRSGDSVAGVRDGKGGRGKYVTHEFPGSATRADFDAEIERSERATAAPTQRATAAPTQRATAAPTMPTRKETPAKKPAGDTLEGEDCDPSVFEWGCGAKWSASPAELLRMTIDASQWPDRGDQIHVIMTSNGSPYLNFQTRILYRTFLRAQKMPGGERMVAFTRILSRKSTEDPQISHEVPTFLADPLTPSCEQWCPFPVADRPNSGACRGTPPPPAPPRRPPPRVGSAGHSPQCLTGSPRTPLLQCASSSRRRRRTPP